MIYNAHGSPLQEQLESDGQPMVKERDLLYWIMSTAQDQSQAYSTVSMLVWDNTTVGTMKMLVSGANVG